MAFENNGFEITIAHRLKVLRAQRHIEISDLAFVLGVNSSDINRIEQGEIPLSPHQILRVCSQWNVPLAYFLIDTNPIIFLLLPKHEADEIDFSFLMTNLPQNIQDTVMQMLRTLLNLDSSVRD